MNEQKEMPAVKKSPSPRFRYWATPPETLTIKVQDIEPFVPKANWKTPPTSELTVDLPADRIFSKNVPRIPLYLLAELLPDHISSSEGMVKLPAAKLAASYRLVEHEEELIPEIPSEPEKLPELKPEAKAADEPKPEGELETKSADDRKPEPEAKADGPKPEANPEAKSASEDKPENKPEAKAATEVKPEGEPEAKAAETKPGAKADNGPKPEVEQAKDVEQSKADAPVAPPSDAPAAGPSGPVQASKPSEVPVEESSSPADTPDQAQPEKRPFRFWSFGKGILRKVASAVTSQSEKPATPSQDSNGPDELAATGTGIPAPAVEAPQSLSAGSASSRGESPDPAPSEPTKPAEMAASDPAPASLPAAVEPPKMPSLELPKPAAEEISGGPTKIPQRRTGFSGLPLFKRRAAFEIPDPPAPAEPVVLPPTESTQEQPAPELPEMPVTPLQPAEAPPAAEDKAVAETEPVAEIPPPATPEPAPMPEPLHMPEPPPQPAIPVRVLRTEHFPRETQNQEIVEQEPLQALFLTEETLTVSRVIELCGCLPGINSCVLAYGSVVVASHNVPDGVDLVSMSAHAADMLKAMRDSSARMGVGTVPAVSLHTEKGVISFFNRDDLTMLAFHRDRGFIPGVREKMAAVLGELTKARLTLPVGGDEAV